MVFGRQSLSVNSDSQRARQNPATRRTHHNLTKQFPLTFLRSQLPNRRCYGVIIYDFWVSPRPVALPDNEMEHSNGY